MEVIYCAVLKLNIELPAEKQDARPKSKLDERFLIPNTVSPTQGLPFFPELPKEIEVVE